LQKWAAWGKTCKMLRKLSTPTLRLSRRGTIFYVRWTDPTTGRSKAVSTGTPDRRQAETQRQQLMDKLLAGEAGGGLVER
jgi:hypothetical protein